MLGRPSKHRRLIALAAIVVGLAGCSGQGQDPKDVSEQTYGSGVPAGATFFATGHRSTVGDVTGETLQGRSLNLTSYRGKYVVVNYWSSTCAPCESEADGFEELSKTLAPKGVQFVGIDLRDN